MASKVKLGVFFMIIAAGVIGLLWAPLFSGLPGGDENIIPRDASKWHIGKGAEYNPTLHYTITTGTMEFFSKIEFLPVVGSEKQTLFVEIVDPQASTEIIRTVPITSAYTFDEVSDDVRPYFKALDATIFSVRDIALEEKYLVKKAVWGTVFYGAVPQEITITDHSHVSFGFGSVDSYTVSYKTGDKENKIWIVDNLPLPVKAQIYDEDGNLQYSYELTSLTAPSTPGFG